MLCMLNSKLPGGLRDRWNWTVQAIRRKKRRKPDLQDLIKFVEEETTLMNDPLFSREALHEYTKGYQLSLRSLGVCHSFPSSRKATNSTAV